MVKILYLSLFMFVSTSAIAQLNKDLDQFFKAGTHEPGFAFLIEKDNKILYKKVAGLANVETGEAITEASNFRMASVSKQFTAMGILLLEKANKLSFEDPVGKFLPELTPRVGNTILIRHLLTHSSGLIDYEELISATQNKQVLDEDVLQLIMHKDTTYFAPGSRFRYSNSGFCLLALIIERITHQPFASFIKENIFTPLGMTTSYVYSEALSIRNRAMGYAIDSTGKVVFSDQSITSATKGDGGVYTSLVDYVKWVHALQQNKLLNLQEVISKIRFRIDTDLGDSYAAGWFQMGLQQEVLFHSGSTCGFNNYVIEVPGQHLSVIYFSNLANSLQEFKGIVAIIKENGLGDFSHFLELHNMTN